MKKSYKYLIAILGIIFGGLALGKGVEAITYQDSKTVDVQFTWDSYLGLDIDEDSEIKIAGLAPGEESAGVLSIAVDTNTMTGYNISATVGNATYNTTDLVFNGTGDKFSMMSSATTLSNMTAGTWGCTMLDSSVSSANYGTITFKPLSTSTDTTIYSTTDTSEATKRKTPVYLYIGAAAKDTQLAGDYSNVINLSITAKVASN